MSITIDEVKKNTCPVEEGEVEDCMDCIKADNADCTRQLFEDYLEEQNEGFNFMMESHPDNHPEPTNKWGETEEDYRINSAERA